MHGDDLTIQDEFLPTQLILQVTVIFMMTVTCLGHFTNGMLKA